MLKETIKEYVQCLIQEGFLKAPQELLNEINDWVLGIWSRITIKNKIEPKMRSLKLMAEDLNEEDFRFNLEKTKKEIFSIIKRKNTFARLKVPYFNIADITEKNIFNSSTLMKIENENNGFMLIELPDHDLSWNIPMDEDYIESELRDFWDQYAQEVENSFDVVKDEIEYELKDLIKTLVPLKSLSQKTYDDIEYGDYGNIKNNYMKDFQYKNTPFYVEIDYVHSPSDRQGHYNDREKIPKIVLFLKHFELDKDNIKLYTIEEKADSLKALISHELKHLIQFRSKEGMKIGLPPPKIRNKDADIDGFPINKKDTQTLDRYGRIDHRLRDIEFQTNLDSAFLELKPIFSEIPEEYRTPIFKLVLGQTIRAPMNFSITKKKYSDKIEKFNEFMRYFNKSPLRLSRAYYMFKKFKEEAPEKYKKAAKELYKELNSVMNMGNILTDPEYIDTIKQRLDKIKQNGGSGGAVYRLEY